MPGGRCTTLFWRRICRIRLPEIARSVACVTSFKVFCKTWKLRCTSLSRIQQYSLRQGPFHFAWALARPDSRADNIIVCSNTKMALHVCKCRRIMAGWDCWTEKLRNWETSYPVISLFGFTVHLVGLFSLRSKKVEMFELAKSCLFIPGGHVINADASLSIRLIRVWYEMVQELSRGLLLRYVPSCQSALLLPLTLIVLYLHLYSTRVLVG